MTLEQYIETFEKPDFKIEVDTFELLDLLKELKHYRADVQPVKHAKWVLFDKDCCGRAFYCSNCRKVTTTEDFENTPLEREEYFCPRCGADMRNE